MEKTFEVWFEELKNLARAKDEFNDLGIANTFDSQPSLYREYYDDKMSPDEALDVTMDRA